MKCPDCDVTLPGDGSCCDTCGWTWHGGGDDPKLPSKRSAGEIKGEITRRRLRRINGLCEYASAHLREAIGQIGALPDTRPNAAVHEMAIRLEDEVRTLQHQVKMANIMAFPPPTPPKPDHKRGWA